MCCFSGEVKDVSSTRLFARALGGGRQLLVYELSLDASSEVAMVLPVPIARGATEDSVRFVDFSGCPKFFAELDALYPKPQARAGGPFAPASAAPPFQTLKVKQVGSFEASFAPTRSDLSRLDARFRLSSTVMDALTEHASSGFVVFQLKGSGERRVHPMAFEFPLADASKLFFPTVHVHDGEVHERAKFDHLLYAQPLESWGTHMTWWRAPLPTSSMSAAARAHVAVTPIYRSQLNGELPNRDVSLDFATLEGRSKLTEHAYVRVNTAWEMLASPGRGAATSAHGLDPQVWAELQVTEETRRRVASQVSAALETALPNEPGVIPYDAQLEQVWPDFYGTLGAVAPEVKNGCQVHFSERGRSVMSVEVRVGFASLPSKETCARVRALVQSALP
ncbi:MAG: hypothetical protein QM817_01245 [Archangium sp.]